MDILHLYTAIDGEKVDVAHDHEIENMHRRNIGQRGIIPVSISGVKIILCREGSNGY